MITGRETAPMLRSLLRWLWDPRGSCDFDLVCITWRRVEGWNPHSALQRDLLNNPEVNDP
jgi:hypothetical protein